MVRGVVGGEQENLKIIEKCLAFCPAPERFLPLPEGQKSHSAKKNDFPPLRIISGPRTMTIFLYFSLFSMPADDEGITPLIILQNIQNMHRVMMAEFASLRKEMNRRFTEVHTEISLIHRIVATMQVADGNMDKRLDDIEIEQLPKRVRRLEAKVLR